MVTRTYSKKYKIVTLLDKFTGLYQLYCREYNEDLYSDELGCLEPEVTINNITNIYRQPEDVTGFSVRIYLESLIFQWEAVDYPNATYEIRVGTSWEDGNVVATGLTGINYSGRLFTTGTKTYWIKAKTELWSIFRNSSL